MCVDTEGWKHSLDLAGQVHSALRTVATGVRGADGDVEDIARSTFYVVDRTSELADELRAGTARAQESEGMKKDPYFLANTRI
jgi:hypothetical protein